MKNFTKSLITLFIFSLTLQAGSFMDMVNEGVKNFTNGKNLSQNTQKNSISDNQTALGLKEALKFGVKEAIATLGKDGGFLNNPAFKIPLPKNLQKAETILRKAGAGKYADDLIVAINKAAEKAVPETANIFMDAISSMSFQDAQAILTGGDTAATEYFKKTTKDKLIKKITPIVKESMKENSVATYYKTFNEYYSKYAKGFVENSQVGALAKNFGLSEYLPGSDESDLESYVTNKTINSLFKTISQKEKLIRENPAFRTTDLLKKVFGK